MEALGAGTFQDLGHRTLQRHQGLSSFSKATRRVKPQDWTNDAQGLGYRTGTGERTCSSEGRLDDAAVVEG